MHVKNDGITTTLRKMIKFLLLWSITAVITSFHVRPLIVNSQCKCFQSQTSISTIPTQIIPTDFTGAGCVLLSQAKEFDHFFSRQAIFIFEYGQKRGSKGVILNKQTAFSMGETSPNIGVFEGNTVYLGGQDGSDMATMFHKYDFDGGSKSVGSGIYVGGIGKAREYIENRKAVPKDFKFFFNHAEWGPGLLEKEISEGRWDVCKIPPDMILSQDSYFDCWSYARNELIKLNSNSNENS